MHPSSFAGLSRLLGVVVPVLAYGCSHEPTAPARVGPPSALQIVSGNSQTAPPAEILPSPLTVQVLDAAGRGVANVTVDWRVTSGGGTLLAPAFPTVSDSTGVTDSTGLVLVLWRLGSQLDAPQTAVATCCGGMTAPFTAQAQLSLAQRIHLFGDFQTDTVGHTLAQPIVVQLLQADGKPAVGIVVTWATHSPGGQLSPTSARTDSTGRASTNWTLGTLAGEETTWVNIGFPDASVIEGPVIATALAGSPVRLAITPTSTTMAVIILSRTTVQAPAFDRYGNPVGYPASISSADTTVARVVERDAVGLNHIGEAHFQARRHGTTWVIAQIAALRDSTPLTVLAFSAVSQGASEICGVSLAGDVYCWDYNPFDGPSSIPPIAKALGLGPPSAEWHTCALTTGGQAYCWGRNLDGEVGDGSPNYATDSNTSDPVAVGGGHLFSTIRAGHRHTCAVTTSGDAYCWGANSGGQLGRDTLTSTCTYAALNPCSNWPIPVAGGLIFTQVSAGWEHSCGVTTGGSAYCWGLNDSGQLGNDSTSTICGALEAPEPPRLPHPCSRVPRLVEGGLTFTSVHAGGHFTCGLAVTGDAYCWGYGLDGNLGDGTHVSSIVPVKVAGGLAFTDVQAGYMNACGLTTSGQLYCWGAFFGATPVLPIPYPPGLQFSALGVGGGALRGCAVTTANDLYCF